MITPIFNLQKAVQSMLYVANHVETNDFRIISKILYFADRSHLSGYGRTITGDFYIALDDGPVPSRIFDILRIVRGDALYSAEKKSEFETFFKVRDWNCLVPQKEVDLNILSESDVKELDKSISSYGALSLDEIRAKSCDLAWSNTLQGHIIDLRDIMLENGDDEGYIDYVSKNIELQKLSSI